MSESSEEPLDLILLGGQTAGIHAPLKKLLLHVSRSRTQREFISHASVKLKTRIERMDFSQRKAMPSFQSIHDLARIYNDSNEVCHPAICSVLLCITQLLQIFNYLERDDRPSGNNVIVGLCTGSLAAAAYATSATLEDLASLAVPTIAIAFELGLQADAASAFFHEQGSSPECWSMAISQVTEAEVLAMLKEHDPGHSLNAGNQCFVSAIGCSGLTVSGPPSALRKFNDILVNMGPTRKTRYLPIYAVYHAPHIHRPLEMASLLQNWGIRPEVLAPFACRRTILSPCTGRPLEAMNAMELFQIAVNDILREPLRIDRITTECTRMVKTKGISSVCLAAIAPASGHEGIAAALQSTGASVTLYDPTVQGDMTQGSAIPSEDHAPLAIVGMSGRFPGAHNTEEFWKVLEAGLDMHRMIPEDRFNISSHVDPTGKAKNTSWTPYGCFIDNPGDFDARFFNISPREALQTDPMQRLALVTAYEALEMAGFVPGRTRSTALERVGTFYGQTSDDYRDVNASQDIDTYFITGGIRAFGPGRINYHFKFGGPSYSIDTACSSGLASIQLACASLWSGDCGTAIAGGLSLLTSPDLYSGLSRGQFLSKTGSCKTFDNDADGYCRADGIGTVVIKRLDEAEADRDNVLAVVLGASTNHSAEAISITHPHAEAQSNLYREILQQSGTDSTEVGYIEMHGTGTQAGDATEMTSVLDVFAPDDHTRDPNNPLYVGSAKANIGHGEASSGLSALIKSILILDKGLIPPHVGIKSELNKSFPDLGARGVYIPQANVPFSNLPGGERKILVNNFSAAGGNTGLLIQEAPEHRRHAPVSPYPLHAVTVSGHTQSSLKGNTERLIEYLVANPNILPGDLSYTTTARRRHHQFRATVAEDTIDHIRVALEKKQTTRHDSLHLPVEAEGQKKAFVFTGQGSIYSALAHDLYMHSTKFRTDIDDFDSIVERQGYPSFMPLVRGDTNIDLLSQVQLQTGLLCVQMALARLWASWDIKPSMVMGHSLGEYAALQVSGILSVNDVIFLVAYRAQLLEKRCKRFTHSMLAVAAPVDDINPLPDDLWRSVELACLNSPLETVLSGESHAIDRLSEHLLGRKIRCTKMRLPYAYHSSQMDVTLDEFEQVARRVNMNTPQIPMISTLTGKLIGKDSPVNASYLRRHCRQPVLFNAALDCARDMGILTKSSVFVEIGPHPVCSGMIKTILGPSTNTLSTLRRKENPWGTIINSLALLHDWGFDVNWSGFHQEFEGDHCLLHLPHYAFDDKNYWIGYRNDWTLRKGDRVPALNERNEGEDLRMLSASVHRVAADGATKQTTVYESDLCEPRLHSAISGHRVNGSALCPSSIYADIALTIASHIRHNLEPDTVSGYSVVDMEVSQPLIIRDSGEDRVLLMHACHDIAANKIAIQYSSASADRQNRTTHASCIVEYGASEKQYQKCSRSLHLVQDRIDRLRALLESGEGDGVSKVSTGLAYRLFSSLVTYDPAYRRMGEILFASQLLEASATVKLDMRSTDGGFFCSPYWIDSLAHISGFIMNGNDTTDYTQAVYISHGWESLQFFTPPIAGERYQTYVKMCPAGETMVSGDVWVIHNDTVAAMIGGLRFQRIPRTVLDMLLPPVRSGQGSAGAHSTPFKPMPRELAPSPKRAEERSPVSRTATKNSLICLIAQQVGVDPSEISCTDSLHQLGIDSLMSLTLVGSFQEQFGLDISPSDFVDCSSIGQLLDILLSDSSCETSPLHLRAVTTPESYNSSSDSPIIRTPTESSPRSTSQGTANLIISVISEETGIAASELNSTVELSQLGLDSLMSLLVLGKLRDIGIELPMDFFLKLRTMGDIFQTFPNNDSFADTQSSSRDIAVVGQGNEHEQSDDNASEIHHSQDSKSAQAVLLQACRNPSSHKQLFLFPDGSGAPAAYANLHRLHPDFSVYGLICPSMNSPDDDINTIKQLVRRYLTTIKEHQQSGPYYLGGWSVGGILAFEASKQLSEAGEETRLLLLIDAPCPTILPPMSPDFIEFLKTKGMFGRIQQVTPTAGPQRTLRLVLENFKKTVHRLAQYQPAGFLPTRKAPNTYIIWAQEGVSESLRPHDSGDGGNDPIQAWIMDKRTDFGPNGWDTLLPRDRISTVSTPGSHFSLMGPANIENVSDQLRSILAEFL